MSAVVTISWVTGACYAMGVLALELEDVSIQYEVVATITSADGSVVAHVEVSTLVGVRLWNAGIMELMTGLRI